MAIYISSHIMTIYYTYIHSLQHILNLSKHPIIKSILPFFITNRVVDSEEKKKGSESLICGELNA